MCSNTKFDYNSNTSSFRGFHDFPLGGRRVGNVRSILQTGLDKVPLTPEKEQETRVTVSHENIRGADFFH